MKIDWKKIDWLGLVKAIIKAAAAGRWGTEDFGQRTLDLGKLTDGGDVSRSAAGRASPRPPRQYLGRAAPIPR